MKDAVVARDKNTYLSHVDLSDPTFALEHTRWVEGWLKEPPTDFSLDIDGIAVNGESATGDLNMYWKMKGQEVEDRYATLPAQFSHGVDGKWRYAGEHWVSMDTENFTVRVLPGLEDVAGSLIPELPEVYDHVTSSLGYSPSGKPEIKLYDSPRTLVAATLLSLPDAPGWNEPGEALKVSGEEFDAYLKETIAHEFTHYLTFEMAGTKHTRMPWWLEEGLADYVESRFEESDYFEKRLDKVRGWALENKLADWGSISDFDTTPVELWTYVYPQGYAMVRYVTEKYGKDLRNRWLSAMAADMEIKQATIEVLGLSFDELDRGFVAWLKQG